MKLKAISIAILLTTLGLGSAFAASNVIPVGANLGYGDASNKHTVFSSTANPSWISGSIHEENNYGFGLSGGIRIKQKGYSKLTKQYNSSVKPLLENFSSSTNPASDSTKIINNLNTLIINARDDFYGQQDFAVSLPIVITNGSFGGLGIELSGTAVGRESLLSANTPISGAYTNGQTVNQFIDALTIQSAIYLKTAVQSEIALSYGNQVYQGESGNLSLGVRGKFMQAKLVRSINNLGSYLKTSAKGGSITDQIQNDIKAHTSTSNTDSNFGVDLGLQWFAKNWMAGLSLLNANSPSFAYNGLTVASYYGNQVSTTEKVTLVPQGRVEASVYSQNRNWTLSGSYDLNKANDLVNQQYQWATASVSYDTSVSGSWWYALIPDVRLGYRTNLTGDKHHYITPGFTWGFLSLDIGFSEFSDIDRVIKGDPNDLPKAFMANIGLEFYF